MNDYNTPNNCFMTKVSRRQSLFRNYEAEYSPSILKLKVEKAKQKANTPGADDIPVELLKRLNDEDIIVLFNLVYQSGKLRSDWQISIFIALPKNTKSR